MVQAHQYNGLTWIDIESPTRAEITEIVTTYNLHPTVGDELLNPSSEPKVELHKGYVYLNLDVPSRIHHGHQGTIIKKELDFVVGKNFIITVRYDAVESLHNFSKVFETNAILDKGNRGSMGEHAGFVFYYMLKRIYSHTRRDLGNIREDIQRAESRIYEGHEKRMVVVLSNIGREIIDARQVLRTHGETLELVGIAMEKLFGVAFRYQTDDLTSDYRKVEDDLTNLHELLGVMRDTNDSLLSSKQNETMKIFTMMAFITFPLSLFIALFALPTTHVPIIGRPFDFEIIVGIIVLAILSMLGFFKYKKWL